MVSQTPTPRTHSLSFSGDCDAPKCGACASAFQRVAVSAPEASCLRHRGAVLVLTERLCGGHGSSSVFMRGPRILFRAYAGATDPLPCGGNVPLPLPGVRPAPRGSPLSCPWSRDSALNRSKLTSSHLLFGGQHCFQAVSMLHDSGANEHQMDCMGLKAINTPPCLPGNFCQGSEMVLYIGAHLR